MHKLYLTDCRLFKAQDFWLYGRSLLNIVNNLAEETHKINCTNCNSCLEYTNAKDDLIEYKSLCFNKNYQQKRK